MARVESIYRYPVKVGELLARSFPDPGGAEAFRREVEADVGVDRLGIDCGGSRCPKCEAFKGCIDNSDCVNNLCLSDHTCAECAVESRC